MYMFFLHFTLQSAIVKGILLLILEQVPERRPVPEIRERPDVLLEVRGEDASRSCGVAISFDPAEVVRDCQAPFGRCVLRDSYLILSS